MFVTLLQCLAYAAVALTILGAWVSGALDPYQKRLQEIALHAMGESKVSYGLKSILSSGTIVSRSAFQLLISASATVESLTGKKLVEEENLSKIQTQFGQNLGGLFAKGGPGWGIGNAIGKGL
ncbi:hypothetical protein FQN50_000870 [Emmonsiellopsis sp. PD_5]|nr:hypothetical protein FQN50_000870 [Emmonsiellopsis sp. PD_5]